jgi:hypothetical protein
MNRQKPSGSLSLAVERSETADRERFGEGHNIKTTNIITILRKQKNLNITYFSAFIYDLKKQSPGT